MPSRNWKWDCQFFLEELGKGRRKDRKHKLKEKELAPVEPMGLPPAVAEMFPLIEELTNSIVLRIALVRLLKQNNGFSVRVDLRGGKRIFGNSIDVGWNFILVSFWFISPCFCRGSHSPKRLDLLPMTPI